MTTLSDAQKGLITVCSILIVGWVLGLGTGWQLWQHPTPIVHVVPKPQINNADGSVVLPVQPSQNMQPAHPVPHGGHVETTASVTIQTNQPTASIPNSQSHADTPPMIVPCPPVTVDITIYRESDGTRRIEVSTPDGKIVKGMQIQNGVGPPSPRILKNSVGVVAGTAFDGQKSIGAYYDRDWKFIRWGGEITKNTYSSIQKQGWEIRAKIGINF